MLKIQQNIDSLLNFDSYHLKLLTKGAHVGSFMSKMIHKYDN